ncbi:Retrotransposable element Tf2 [Gossypium australe]|uniref:Retrotransposable element Tf2 n=1 Tax=Gossypium australe TaxID=47621 RepID=A0A5B6X2P2_9ROSI|nr:Retrotransposable element Tf2 [Gossypium australe]
MDFITGLPITPKKKYAMWVIVDRLTKLAHFISVCVDYALDKLAELYIAEVVRLHGVSISIISDRDPRFTSRYWKKLQEALVEYTNGTIRSIYGHKCRTPLHWTELSEKKIHGVDLVRETEEKVKVIRDSLKAASDRQKSYANLKRKEIEFQYHSNPTHVIPPTEIEIRPDMTYEEEPINILAHEVKQLRNKSIALVKVLCQKHGVEEAMWEPEEPMKEQYPNLFTDKIFGDENL